MNTITIRHVLPWMNIFFALLYLKEYIIPGKEADVLHLKMVAYIPFMYVLWFCSAFFWNLFTKEKGLSRIFPTIFIIVLLSVPVGILLVSKDVFFSLPVLVAVLEPLKNRFLFGSLETSLDSPKIFLLIASFVLLFAAALLSFWIGLQHEEYFFGFLYYLFLFFFETRWVKYIIGDQPQRDGEI